MSTETRSANRTIAIVAGVLTVLCLCCICVLGVTYWQRDQLGEILPRQLAGLLGLAPQTQAAQMMPPDTPIYIGMSLNLQNQAGYQNLKKIYLDNPDVQDVLDQLKADFSEETSLDFDEDIKPWLGAEAALALPNAEDLAGLSDVDSPQILLTVSTQDVEASEAFLDKLRANEAEDGRPYTEDEYQGVTYWFQEAEFDFNDNTYLAIFNDFVVFTNSEEALFDAIDRSESGGESLADNEDFQLVLDALPGNGALFSFVDYQAIIGLAMEESPVQLEPEQLSQLKAIGGVGMAVTLQPDGVQIDTAVQIDPAKLTKSARAALNRPGSPNAVLKRIPADAIGFYNGYDLRAIWQQLREGLAASPDFEEQLADLESGLGLSLDEDIFGWMTGEFALVVTKARPADEFTPPIGGYLLIGVDDVDLAQNKVADLTDLISQEMFIEFQSETVAGNEMQVIADPFTEAIMGGYGFWDNYLIVGYLEDALAAAFAAPDDPATDSPHFESVSGRLPSKNYGYFFVDIDAARGLVEAELSEFEREDYEAKVRPFIEPLRAFGVAADASSGKGEIQIVTMFLLITEE